jgi:hypothetical protein
MAENFRRHHAQRDVQIVLVPFEIGSPKEARQVKPGRYPSNPREAWRPQRAIPAKRGKAEALRKLLERMNRQSEDIRAFMAEARRQAA